MPACGITASGGDRKTKAAAVVPARDRALLQDDECHRATACHGPAIGLASRPGRGQAFPLLAVHEDRSQPVCLLKHGRDAREAWWAFSQPPHSELVKVANDAVLLDGRDVVRKI